MPDVIVFFFCHFLTAPQWAFYFPPLVSCSRSCLCFTSPPCCLVWCLGFIFAQSCCFVWSVMADGCWGAAPLPCAVMSLLTVSGRWFLESALVEMLVHCGRQAGSFVSLLGIFGCVYGGRGGVLIVGIWEHSYRKVERWGVCWGAIRWWFGCCKFLQSCSHWPSAGMDKGRWKEMRFQ